MPRDRSVFAALAQEGEQEVWDWSRLPVQHDFLTATDRFTLFSGGFGCGKTSVLCAKTILLLTAIPNNLGFLGRMDGKALRASTIQTLREMLPDEYLARHNEQQGFLKLRPEFGGSKLIYGDFKDINDFKNIPLGFFAIDQAEEAPKEVWDYLVGRLRRRNPIIRDGLRQYYVAGSCPPRAGQRHYALFGDTRCRLCAGDLPAFRETVLKQDNGQRPWDLICYSTYGFAASNPEGPSHWLFKYFPDLPGVHGPSGPGKAGYRSFYATAYDALKAGFVGDTYVHDMEALYAASPMMADRYLHGMWVEAQGLVYPGWDRTQHIISRQARHWSDCADAPAQLLDDRLFAYEYVDHGLTAPTAVGWVVVQRCECGCGRDNFYLVDEHYQGGRAVDYHAQCIKAHRETLGRPIAATYLDSAAFSKTLMRKAQNEDSIQNELYSVADEYMDHGIFPVPNQKDWDSGYNRIAEALAIDPTHMHPVTGVMGAPHVFVMDHCTNFIREIESYKWKKLKNVESRYREEPEDRDDHHMDGLNGFMASRPQGESMPLPESEKDKWLRELDIEMNGRPSHMGD